MEVHGVVLLSVVPFLVDLAQEAHVLLAVGPVLARGAPFPLEGLVLVVRAEAVPEMRKT